MRNLPNHETGYNGDDFMYNRITIMKSFEVGDITYKLFYTTGSRIIHIRKRMSSDTPYKVFTMAISVQMLDNCFLDTVKLVCDKINKA